jgi:hemoglobin/transferrin/lactoferrin receptor protein
MNCSIFPLCAAFAVVCQSAFGQVQPDPHSVQPIEHIIVTSTRTEADRTELPYAVTTIDRRDFETSFARNLPETLAHVAGVLVQKSSNGHGSPYVRGFTGYRTLTLIDGVRYNNSVYRDGANEYFSLIDSNASAAIEVLGGPASVLYGSDAVGGVLNVHSRASSYASAEAGTRFLHGQQRISFGSADNNLQSRTEIDTGIGRKAGLHLGFSRKDFSNLTAARLGKQHHTGYDEHAWDARLDTRLNQHWRLRFAYQQLEQDDVWRTHATVFAKPFAGTTAGSDLRRTKDYRRHLGYIRLEGLALHRYLDNVQLTVSHQGWNEDANRVRGDGRGETEFFVSRMLGLDLQLQSHLRGAQLIYGFDVYRDKVDSGRRDFRADATLARVRIQGPVGDDAEYLQQGAYMQAIVEPLDFLQLSLGSRYTFVSAEIGRFEDPLTTGVAQLEQSWAKLVNSVRLAYIFNVEHSAMAWSAVSESFRAPNIADLSRLGASRSNELEVAARDLDAEKFLTYELGLRTATALVDFSLVAYHTRIRDYITSTPTGRFVGSLTEVSKRNSSRGFVRGLEFSLSRDWSRNLNTWANVTWLQGELDSASAVPGASARTEPLSRVMPLSAHMGLRWTTPLRDVWAAVQLSVVGRADQLSSADKADTQRIPPGGTPGYELVNVSFGKRLGRHFELAFGITNVFDVAYRTHGSGVNDPGIGMNLGLTAEF